MRNRVKVSIILTSGCVAPSVSSSTSRSHGTSRARHMRSTRSGKSRCCRLSAEMLKAMLVSMQSSLHSTRLFHRSGHCEPERFTESEGRFEDTAVESADDQHRRTIIVRRQEAEQLDPVHSGHSEVERNHVGLSAKKFFAKFSVVGGY